MPSWLVKLKYKINFLVTQFVALGRIAPAEGRGNGWLLFRGIVIGILLIISAIYAIFTWKYKSTNNLPWIYKFMRMYP